MPRIGRILEVLVLELFEQESHAFEAVAAMAVAGTSQEPDHGLVDLHAPVSAGHPRRPHP